MMWVLLGVAVPIMTFLGFWCAGVLARFILLKYVSLWAKNTKTEIDDVFINAVKTPFIVWFLMFGLYFAIKFSWLPPEVVVLSGKILFVLGVVSVTLVCANIISRLLQLYIAKFDSKLPGASLIHTLTLAIVFCLGALIILNNLGISITPILASLGVGGLAVALALQDTLGNFFAGFHIIAAKQVRIGDYIKLDSGEEGYVSDINWRTTQIVTIPNHVVLVPNAKLVQAIISNYHLPDKQIVVTMDLGIHYNSDLEKVERVTCEAAKEVMREVPGGVPEFDPIVRFHTFADFSINFKIVMRAQEFSDQGLLKHEFVKRLHKRYAKEGIVIPYPVQAVNLDQEKAAGPA
jgi:small-conductance mechanosensitive channel